MRRVADAIFAPLDYASDAHLVNFSQRTHMLMPPHFARSEAWTAVSDAEVGGRSTSKFWDVSEVASDGVDTGPHVKNGEIVVGKFARFEGETVNDLPEDIKGHGFAAVKTGKVSPSVDLFDYEGVEVLCRGNGRLFMLNLEPDTYFSDDLYQHYVKPFDGEWSTLVLPFDAFVLTAAGHVRAVQRKLDAGPQVKGLSFSVVDGEEGPFQLDVAYVKAISSIRDHMEEIRKTRKKGKHRKYVW